MTTPVPATIGGGGFVTGAGTTDKRLAEDGTWVDDTKDAQTNTANTWSANQTLADVDLVLGTTTGTKLGTAATQKLGFWGATPVVRPLFATGAGHTVDELVTVLQTIGLLKQS